MFGMIRRYLKGRARIIAKAQMKNTLKKVAKNIRDDKYSDDSAISNANTIKGNARKKSALGTQIMAIILSASLVAPYNVNAATAVVSNPERIAQAYTQFVEQIEKYNTMIKNAQDTLDTMNKVNDAMNTANNTLNNLQTGLADPTQLYHRAKANLEAIKENAERIAKSLERRKWEELIFKLENASCNQKWTLLKKQWKEKVRAEQARQEQNQTEQDSGQDSSDTNDNESASAAEKYDNTMQEIDDGMNDVNRAVNGGWSKANQHLEKWGDELIDFAGGLDPQKRLERRKVALKNPEEYQVRICKMIEEKINDININNAKSAYFKAVAEGNHKLAKQAFKSWKDLEFNKQQTRNKETEEIIDKAKGNLNIKDKDAAFDVNENDGSLTPNKIEDWNKTLRTDYKTNTQIAESLPIPTTDEKGNKSTKIVWVAKQSAIQEILKIGNIDDALSLQNKRNMVIALQGDALAIQKSQLETSNILNLQTAQLQKSLNILGNVVNRMLELKQIENNENLMQIGDTENGNATIEVFDENGNFKETQKGYATIETDQKTKESWQRTIENSNWYFDQETGRLKLGNDINQDSSGIGE